MSDTTWPLRRIKNRHLRAWAMFAYVMALLLVFIACEWFAFSHITFMEGFSVIVVLTALGILKVCYVVASMENRK